MRKFLVLFSFVPILLISFLSLEAMTLQQNHQSQQTAEKTRTKQSLKTGINETDFINTMFLRSSFFENWSDTNYFINPTLKTSKLLTYNDKWYLDFLKDSYSTGISYDKPSDKFMDLYKNWDNYVKQYNINKFYDVDRKQFLKELTNFSYSFAKYFNTVEVINKLEKSVDNLQNVDITSNFGNWKKVYANNKPFNTVDNKYYIIVWRVTSNSKWNINGFDNWQNDNLQGIGLINNYRLYRTLNSLEIKQEPNKIISNWNNDNGTYFKSFYRWDGTDKPDIHEIDSNGDLKYFSEYYQNVRYFLLKYIDVIVQENIRVQQGDNPDYESPIVGTQRIIFYFEIVDESDRYTAMYFIKKSIYRMILTIDKNNNIIAGSLELKHTKTASNDPSYFYKEIKLGFLFTFIKDKDNIFNFDANTNSYL